MQKYSVFRTRLLTGMLLAAVLGTLFHFIYDWTGQSWPAGLFFPVNESVWEHMKLVFWPMVLLNLYFTSMYKDKDYHVEPAVLLGTVVGLISIPTLFYTYRGILGYGVSWVDVVIYYVSLLFALLAVLHLVKHMFWKEGRGATVFLWIIHLLFALAFFWFTYHPPGCGIFQPY